jgi:hypothetical protein
MLRRLLYNAFYWTFDRGSWQWDIACLCFLVVIFATPGDFLEAYTRHPIDPDKIHAILKSFFVR